MSEESKVKKGERLAKRIARAGVCSRRQAEALIEQGKVVLNGDKVLSPAINVTPSDKIIVNGKPLPQAEETVLYRFNKPTGLVTTASDEKGRKTVFDAIPAELGRLISVGRLDINSEGLLLMTNDGELARYMELPKTAWSRSYRVRAFGEVDEARLKALKKGTEIEGVKYGPMDARVEETQGERQSSKNIWLRVMIREGKNREVRKVLESVGLQVNRLIRVSYGPFQLGKLPSGQIEVVSAKALTESLPKDWRK